MRFWAVLLLSALTAACAVAQQASSPAPPASPAIELYRELRTVGLNTSIGYKARDIVLDRGDLHFYLNDGTIAFLKPVNGHVTGAYFEGDGEVLVRPPNQMERTSLGLFTGLGYLDAHFASAFIRFNDDTYRQLIAQMQPVDDGAAFATEHADLVSKLSGMDALRLFATFTDASGGPGGTKDVFFHARVISQLGDFDAVYDSMADEQVMVGAPKTTPMGTAYDVWMSFPEQSARSSNARRVHDPWRSSEAVHVAAVKVDAKLEPPETIEATADLTLDVHVGGQRALMFELSRYLKVQSVTANGQPVDFIQNEAIAGTDLAKRGNDLVTAVLPQPLKAGQPLEMSFVYKGNVMTQAGVGLLYVGERGTWYPNRGPDMTMFDLRFRWPSEWTLVVTGKRTSLETNGSELVGTWTSEGLIPLAGFNLGQYERRSAQAGKVTVESFTTGGVEQALAQSQQPRKIVVTRPGVPGRIGDAEAVVVLPPVNINPTQESQQVADRAAKAVEQYSQWFGPYPYSTLALTQFPGPTSQGWPTLIFLSSKAFLNNDEMTRLNMSPFVKILYGEITEEHETAHQWWGDLVGWSSYRDQWVDEALANYSAIMLLEQTRPQDVKTLLDGYRDDLLLKNADGRRYADAGPVTLGYRLSSSVFPAGYVAISYGRGTWLLHMLRTMFHDLSPKMQAGRPVNRDARFLAALRAMRDEYAHKDMSTEDMERVFEKFMPPGAAYEEPHSLQWFFDGWINGTSIPKIALANVKFSRGGKEYVNFTIRQTECPDDLVTSVPVYAVTADGRQEYVSRVFADGHEAKFRLAVPAGTKRLVLDPEDTVLAQIDR